MFLLFLIVEYYNRVRVYMIIYNKHVLIIHRCIAQTAESKNLKFRIKVSYIM